MADFIKGDFVCHNTFDEESDDTRKLGYVAGFCPGEQWVRVKTFDGQIRIWLKVNVFNIDVNCSEGNHAPQGIKGT